MCLLGAYIVRGISVLTDELDQFRIGVDALIQFDGPGLGVRLRIVDGNFDLQVAVVCAPKPFGDLA